MYSQKTESETDDDDFELKMKSPMKIIKRQIIDTIEDEIWKSNETMYKKSNLNTSQEEKDKLMLSFHDFVLEYKENPKNKEFIYKVLKKNDDILIYAIMLFQKDIDIDKIISLQNYKSYIRQDYDLKFQELYFYDELQ